MKHNFSKLIFNYFKAFLSKGIGVIYGLILLKLLSTYLSDESFSNYYIFYNASFYFYTVFFTIQGNAILRYYHIKGESEIIDFVNTLNSLSFLINFLFFIVLSFFNVVDKSILFTVLVLIQSLGVFYNELNYLRIKHYFDRVLFVIFLQALIAISGIIILKKTLDFSTVLMIISASFFIPAFISNKGKIFFVFRPIKLSLIKNNYDVIKYALPIVFIALANSTMSSLDQFILKYYNFNLELSAYIANYTIAEKSVVFILSVITLVFVPIVFKKYNELSLEVFKDIYRVVLIFILISLVLILILFYTKDFLALFLTNKDYLSYSWVIPYIAFGGVFLGINSIVSEIFTVAKKSIILMYCYVTGMMANLILNIIYIPIYGISGAVYSSIITYMIMLIITLFFAYKQYKRVK